ncbi:MAG TPA: outer membrane beta-barrel protein [Puia sp.]|nr:outer membrane beta-barrel protein [Puia sp.]
MGQKKIIPIILLLAFFSEKIIAQVKMGIVAGPLFTSNTLNNAQSGVINPAIPCFCGIKKEQTKPVFLYSAGFGIDYSFSEEFSISAKTLFALKGWNENVHYADFNSGSSAVRYDAKDSYRFSYFEAPVYFVFSSSLGSKGAVFHAGIGGYADVALQGKYAFHLLNAQNLVEHSGALTHNASEDGLPLLKDSSNLIAVNNLQRKVTPYGANALDVGLSVLLGIENENGFHYDLSFFNGLKNILTTGFYPYPRTNRSMGISISAGYYFNKK